MSVNVMEAVWKTDLPPGPKLVLLALADWADKKGRCYPGLPALAQKTGKCRRSVQMAIQQLCAAGHLSKRERRNNSSIYWVHPGKDCTPAKTAPVQILHRGGAKTDTPEAQPLHPNRQEPSLNRHKRATALPTDWQPSEFGKGTTCRQVVDSWSPADLSGHLEQFQLHHGAKGTRMLDWQKAWGTWVLNSRKWGAAPAARQGKPDAEKQTWELMAEGKIRY